MPGSWPSLLRERGARGDRPFDSFGDAAAERAAVRERAIVSDLGHLSFVAVRGPDAAPFLQGLTTCDVALVTEMTSSLGALCAVNGRVAVLFHLSRRDDGFLLRLPASLAGSTAASLRRLVFRKKVTIDEPGDALVALGVAGPAGAEAIARIAGDAPDSPGQVVTREVIAVDRAAGDPPRWEITVPVEQAPAVWDQLAQGARPAGVPVWRLFEIEAGVPSIDEQTAESFLPQNLDLERLGGLSFTKGCYPGQEVVARTQYLGQLKRRLCRCRIEQGDAPPPGTALRAVHGDGTRDGGKIVVAAPAGDRIVRALAVVPVAEIEGGASLRLEGETGPEVVVEAVSGPAP